MHCEKFRAAGDEQAGVCGAASNGSPFSSFLSVLYFGVLIRTSTTLPLHTSFETFSLLFDFSK